MSRVYLTYDDGSKIDFNDRGDALYHLKTQGYAGVVDLRDEYDGEAVYTSAGVLAPAKESKPVHDRKALLDLLARAAEHGYVTRADLDALED